MKFYYKNVLLKLKNSPSAANGPHARSASCTAKTAALAGFDLSLDQLDRPHPAELELSRAVAGIEDYRLLRQIVHDDP